MRRSLKTPRMFTIPIPLLILLFSEAHGARAVKKITVLAWERSPFVQVLEHGGWAGLDVHLLRNFAQKYGFEIEFVPMNSSWSGSIISNISIESEVVFTGVEDENFIFGANLIGSRPYHYDALTWCVQRRQPLPPWMNIFYIFNDKYVLAVGFVTFSFLAVTGYVVQQFEYPQWDMNRIMSDGMRIVIGQPITFKPKNQTIRFYFCLLLMGFVAWNGFFVAGLTNTVKNPILQTQIYAISEIIENKFDLAGDENVIRYLRKQSEIYPHAALNRYKVCEDTEKCLSYLESNSQLAVATSLEQARHRRNRIYCFSNKEVIQTHPLKFLVREGCSLLGELNRFIENAAEHGLIAIWLERNRRAIMPRNDDHLKSEILTMRHGNGMLIIAGALITTAIVIFFMENLVHRKIEGIAPSPMWRHVEMIIDAERHFLLNDFRTLYNKTSS